MVERGGGAGLALESLDAVAEGQLRGEDLERDLAREADFRGQVDDRHAAAAEQVTDGVDALRLFAKDLLHVVERRAVQARGGGGLALGVRHERSAGVAELRLICDRRAAVCTNRQSAQVLLRL